MLFDLHTVIGLVGAAFFIGAVVILAITDSPYLRNPEASRNDEDES